MNPVASQPPLDCRAAFTLRAGERIVYRGELRTPTDATAVRQRARHLADLAGLGAPDATAFAAAVSEVARNAIVHAGGGCVEFVLRDARDAENVAAAIVAHVLDHGPGIDSLDRALANRPASSGLIAARRLSDEFDLRRVSTRGTYVMLARHLPNPRGLSPEQAERIQAELRAASTPGRGSLEEAREQNRDLLRALDALRERQAEVERLNAELAETNRGVLALYAELDDKAAALQRASSLKTRFLSDMTHELRTPLNAMISLSRLLLDRVDGELTTEQERQVRLINRSAVSLSEMVNDLLDIARIEAGKTDLHLGDCSTADVLSALRGMFRPLLPEDGRVQLILDEPSPACPRTLFTDERKLSQILRNLISNALKFTERGEVRVRADCDGDAGSDAPMIRFVVQDTGIGIAATDLPRLFHDFEQIDSPMQRRVRGTGLGLPLTRKLARLLGGDVTVESEPNVGSTFTLTIPTRLPDGAADRGSAEADGERDAG